MAARKKPARPKSKDKKPRPDPIYRRPSLLGDDHVFYSKKLVGYGSKGLDFGEAKGVSYGSEVMCSSASLSADAPVSASKGILRSMALNRSADPSWLDGEPERSIETTKLEIAAGAKIDQTIFDDPKGLDYWQKDPTGVLYINYAPANEIDQIIAAGRRGGRADSFMGNMKVGN